jgi:hypothetical protein
MFNRRAFLWDNRAVEKNPGKTIKPSMLINVPIGG